MNCVPEHQLGFAICALDERTYLSNFSVATLVATPTVAALVGQKEKSNKQRISENILKYKLWIYHKIKLLAYYSGSTIVCCGKVWFAKFKSNVIRKLFFFLLTPLPFPACQGISVKRQWKDDEYLHIPQKEVKRFEERWELRNIFISHVHFITDYIGKETGAVKPAVFSEYTKIRFSI